MFEFLKSKLKSIIRMGEKLDGGAVYEEIPKEGPGIPIPEPSSVREPVSVSEPIRQEGSKKLSKKERTVAVRAKQSGKKRSSEMLSDSLLSKKIKNGPLDDVLNELETTLLESDVAYGVVQEIVAGVRNNLSGKKHSREYALDQIVELAMREAVGDVLQINRFDFDTWLEQQSPPTTIMFVGTNGTGKTTAIAKIANRLKRQGKSVVLAACDTFRAGAIEQLSIHASNLDVKIVRSQQDADPASVAYDAVKHACSRMRDAVLIDTAGRMQTNSNLIAEMMKIAKVAKPDLKIFVGDSLAGNDAVEQARIFDDAIGIDAIILTKIDTDAKGGAALSIAKTIGKPIAFVCDGQMYDDIEKFDADWMLKRLFESD